MYRFFFFFFLISPFLYGSEVDRSISSYEKREKRKIDHFDFSGDWLNIKNIDIDAKRKKCVELDLTGNYPLLQEINFQGGFGLLKGQITGQFPKLSIINILCGSSSMTLDFTSQWTRSCNINIRGQNEDVVLYIPHNIGISINTKVGALGKVYVDGLKKKGFGLLNKRYENALLEESPIVLHFNIETNEGNIVVNVCESSDQESSVQKEI